MEESTASLRTYMSSKSEVSGSRVETLSSRPSANRAWSNFVRSSGVQSMGGRGGSGAGTKAWACSPTVDMVTYLPWSLRFILFASSLNYYLSLF